MKSNVSQSGMTLIEMLITTSIVAIIFIVISDFTINSLFTQQYVSEQNDAVVAVRKSLKQLTSEIKETVNADTGAYPLDTVDDQELIFYSDIDNDDYTERVRYYLDGTNLMRAITEPEGDPLEYITEQDPRILAEYIQNDTDPLFYYYNEDYPSDSVTNPLEEPIDITEVRMIEIRLSVNVNPIRLPDTRNLVTFIQLRNLKENF